MVTVQVLMSTFNGEHFIREQIESVLSQEGVNVSLLVRDDGSSDATKEILLEYKHQNKIEVIFGENIGWRSSFMMLLYISNDADYYAFCDQDDIWMPNKLLAAVSQLERMPTRDANLYCSNLNYFKNGCSLGLVNKKVPHLTLQLSLMRSLAAGCTMVFNSELRKFLVNNRPVKVSAHDFWVYQVASLLGNVYYDSNSYILYRQHDNNQIGASINAVQKWNKRIVSAKKNFFNNDRQYAAAELLRLYGKYLSTEKQIIVNKVATFDLSFINRFSLFIDCSYTMGSFINDFWLRLRILFGKI